MCDGAARAVRGGRFIVCVKSVLRCDPVCAVYMSYICVSERIVSMYWCKILFPRLVGAVLTATVVFSDISPALAQSPGDETSTEHVGIAQAALDLALEHAAERTAFGQPLLKLHSVQDRLADMCMLIETARLLTWRAATDLSTRNSAMAKYVAGRNASKVADHAVQILGGRGISTASAAERHYRDARGTQIYGGVTDVQKMLVGFHLIRDYRGPQRQNQD